MRKHVFLSAITFLAITTAVRAQTRVSATIIRPASTLERSDYTYTYGPTTIELLEPTQIPVRDQAIEDFNKVVPFRTCANLTCADQADFETAGVCYGTDRYAVGVGIYPNAVNTSDANLTLTLVNGASEAALWARIFREDGFEEDRDYTRFNPDNIRHELFVGAPANFDLQEADPGCALMVLSRGQPLPIRESGPGFTPVQNSELSYEEFQNEASAIINNTSWCPASFLSSRVVNITREFRYVSNSSLPRCQALAGYVNERVREEQIMFNYRQAFGPSYYRRVPIQVIGGAISGPDVSREPRGPENAWNPQNPRIGSEDCQPTLPESYSLYNVSFADMPLFFSHDGSSLAEVEEFGPWGGRNGTTMVYTAVYGDGENSDPDVRYLCMEMRDPSGAELPGQGFLLHEGISGRNLRESVALFAVAAAGLTVLALQF